MPLEDDVGGNVVARDVDGLVVMSVAGGFSDKVWKTVGAGVGGSVGTDPVGRSTGLSVNSVDSTGCSDDAIGWGDTGSSLGRTGSEVSRTTGTAVTIG